MWDSSFQSTTEKQPGLFPADAVELSEFHSQQHGNYDPLQMEMQGYNEELIMEIIHAQSFPRPPSSGNGTS